MNAPAVATVTTLAPPSPAGTKILRIFISYASEDVRIATAIFKCLRSALGDFSEINMDREVGTPLGQSVTL